MSSYSVVQLQKSILSSGVATTLLIDQFAENLVHLLISSMAGHAISSITVVLTVPTHVSYPSPRPYRPY